jgi:hypothetical protein
MEAYVSTDSSSFSSHSSLIHFSAFLRTLAAPLIVWAVLVAAATLGGQPGVICVTPMAWLLALWCGGQYIRLSEGRQGRWPLLGAALVGVALGTCMGVLFIVASTIGMPVGTAPGEVSKAVILDAIIFIGGVLVCTALSMFTGWLTLRRYQTGH